MNKNVAPLVLEDTNLSTAWCRVLECIVNTSGTEISPLVLSLSGFDETELVRSTLNASLEAFNAQSIETVSETIFPNSLYQIFDYDKQELYRQYLEIFPRLKGIEPSKNGRGTYFQRLIAFDTGDEKVNQLEIIISSLLDPKKSRRSMLQASVFDPSKDHTNRRYQGFPCLQHVTFYKLEDGGLALNSFYAVQYLFQKAYGNWLGLINLGKFVARETGLKLTRFNCFIGVETLDVMTKTDAAELLKQTGYESLVEV